MYQGSVERRRERRVPVEAPLWIRRTGTAETEPPVEHRTKNVGLAGLYFESDGNRPYAINDVVVTSVFIPEPHRRVFPFTRLAGHGRVVRVQEVDGADGKKCLGVALEFSSDVMALTAIPTRS